MYFKYESQLVDFLVDQLKNKYSIKFIVKELRNGNNIADITYTDSIDRDFVIFDDYINTYFYVNQVLNNDLVSIDSINIPNHSNKKKFMNFLKKLETLGYIQINGNNIKAVKNTDLTSSSLISIEAKLSDWRSGLKQALKYREYCNQTYVAVDESQLDKIDINLFRVHNVGLITVNDECIKFIHEPEYNTPLKLEIKYFIEDKFLSNILATSI